MMRAPTSADERVSGGGGGTNDVQVLVVVVGHDVVRLAKVLVDRVRLEGDQARPSAKASQVKHLRHATRSMNRVVNPPGMSGRLPEFNSIFRLPPDVAREIINSRNASNLVSFNGSVLKYCNAGL